MKHLALFTLISAFGLGANAQVIFQDDFENWTGNVPDNWVGAKTTLEADSIAQVTVNVQLGSSACGLTNMESGHKRFTTSQVTVTDGQAYEVNFWVRGAGNIRTGLYDGRASGSGYSPYNPYVAATATWTQVTQTLTAANDTVAAEFILSVQLTGGADQIVVDNVTISTGTVNPPASHSIYEIQFTTDVSGNSPLADSAVIYGGIVTAAYSGGYWIQNGTGPWTGLFIFDNSITPVIGDSVIVTGNVSEYNGLTEISGPSAASIESNGNPVPASALLDINETWDEQWESVLVSVVNTTCTNASVGFGQWVVEDVNGDSLLVDDLIFAYTPIAGTLFDLTGPMYYSFSERKIEPRNAGDIIAGIGEIATLEATVLPNPVSDQMLVQWTGGPLSYTLTDAKGRIAMDARASGSQLTIDVRQLAEGFYTLTLRSDGRLRTERIVVKR